MDVALDANIFLSDPWLQSKRLEAVLHYLKKTRSRVLLLAAVETEVRAAYARHVGGAVDGLEGALRDARRHNVQNLPAIELASLRDITMKAWEAQFNKVLPPALLARIPLDDRILSEVVRRAAERLAPCSNSGKEVRDAVIWLSLLAYLNAQRSPTQIAFISANTRDFAGPDGATLRSELLDDLRTVKGGLEYHSSLESFIKEHAEPIRHITTEWVAERVDTEAVQALLKNYLELTDPIYFRIADSDYSDYYEPNKVEVVYDPSVTLNDVYVWKHDEGRIDVFLEYYAYAEAEVGCDLIREPSRYRGERYYGDYDRDYDDDEFRRYRGFTCYAELTVTVAAQVKEDTLVLDELDEVGSA